MTDKQFEKEIKKKGIAIGIGLLLFNLFFLYIIHEDLPDLLLVFVLISVVILSIYYSAGYYCRKRWSASPWKWGLWLTFPLIGISLLLALVVGIYSIIVYFCIFSVSSIGAYNGLLEARRTIPPDMYRNSIYWKDGTKKGIWLSLFNMFLVSVFFFGRDITFYIPELFLTFNIYFWFGRYYGKRLPEASWKWGKRLTNPLAIATIGAVIILSPIAFAHGDAPRYYDLFSTLAIISYFVANLAGSIGGFIGAKSSKVKELN